MSKFQSIVNIPVNNNPALATLLSREIDSYSDCWEPGTAVHGSLVEYIDCLIKVLPLLEGAGGAKQAAYVLRRSLRALRHASWLQTNEDASSVLDGIHAAPEAVVLGMVMPDGKVVTSVSRSAVSDLGAYCRAVQAKTGAVLVMPWVPTAKDDFSKTTSRTWS